MDDFLLYGYFRVEGVFSTDVADQCKDNLWDTLKCEFGIDRSDMSTWVKKQSIAETYEFDSSPWKLVQLFVCSFS